MKAILLEKAGGVENLHLKEIEKPTINKNEVLVKVKAISLNPADVKAKQTEEMLSFAFGNERPVILGWDISGTVEQIGENVTNFNIGDAVFGMVNFPGKGNAYAEFVAAPEAHLAKKPNQTSFEAAAATTLAALTALQMLQNRVKKGDRVLVHGGSGGVGHFGIQLAKIMGAYVITTASSKNKDLVLALGADEHIDYKSENFQDILTDIDFVLDIFGPDNVEKSLQVIKPNGTIISTAMLQVSPELQKKAEKAKANVQGILVKSNGNDMNTLSNLLAIGKLKAKVSDTFPLNEMRAAHTAVEKGVKFGKIVVTI